MDLALGGSLIVLALIDSTSFGTLLIPIWLLLNPGRVRPGRMVIYLGTIVVFYFLVGVIIALGAGRFLGVVTAALETRVASVLQLIVGVALLVLSFRMDGKKARQRRGQNPTGGRVGHWRERAMAGGSALPLGLVGLALGAATLEVATMLPYLGAIGLITTSELTGAQMAGVLAGYCGVMVAPAALLLVGRLIAGRQVEPALRRISDWMTRNAAGATAWIVGIVGFLVARDAAVRLGLFGWIDQLAG